MPFLVSILLLGISVLGAVVLLIRRINLRHVGPALDVGAGFLSGVLNTSLSTNGPPLVFVLQGRHLEPPAFRGTISQVFALSNVVGLTLFVVGLVAVLAFSRAAALLGPARAAFFAALVPGARPLLESLKGDPRQFVPLVGALWQGLNAILDPILNPIRRMLPHTGALDFSPLVLIVLLRIILIILSYLGSAAYQ